MKNSETLKKMETEDSGASSEQIPGKKRRKPAENQALDVRIVLSPASEQWDTAKGATVFRPR